MTLNSGSTNLIISGVGGQGNVMAARLLASAAMKSGYTTAVGDVFGLTQRGGAVASHIRWSMEKQLPPLIPRRRLDILIGFEPLEAFRTLSQFGSRGTKVLVNDTPVMPLGVQQGRFAYPDRKALCEALRTFSKEFKFIRATEIAVELGNIQSMNMVMLGALYGSEFINLKVTQFEKILASLPAKKMKEVNLQAFRSGFKKIQC